MNHEQVQQSTMSFDGRDNFLLSLQQSAGTKDRATVFPSGERVKVINPNAVPMKLDPPK